MPVTPIGEAAFAEGSATIPGAALAVSAPTVSAVTSSGFSASVTPSGGTAPYSIQWQIAPNNAGAPGAWANDGTASSATSHAFSSLSASTTYWVRAIVSDSASGSVTSTAVSQATAAAAPLAPVLGTISIPAAGQPIVVPLPTVQAVGNTFKILIGTTSGGEVQVATGQTGSYTHSSTLPSTAYYIKIQEVGTGGTSPSSNEVSVTTLALPAGTITGYEAELLHFGVLSPVASARLLAAGPSDIPSVIALLVQQGIMTAVDAARILS